MPAESFRMWLSILLQLGILLTANNGYYGNADGQHIGTVSKLQEVDNVNEENISTRQKRCFEAKPVLIKDTGTFKARTGRLRRDKTGAANRQEYDEYLKNNKNIQEALSPTKNVQIILNPEYDPCQPTPAVSSTLPSETDEDVYEMIHPSKSPQVSNANQPSMEDGNAPQVDRSPNSDAEAYKKQLVIPEFSNHNHQLLEQTIKSFKEITETLSTLKSKNQAKAQNSSVGSKRRFTINSRSNGNGKFTTGFAFRFPERESSAQIQASSLKRSATFGFPTFRVRKHTNLNKNKRKGMTALEIMDDEPLQSLSPTKRSAGATINPFRSFSVIKGMTALERIDDEPLQSFSINKNRKPFAKYASNKPQPERKSTKEASSRQIIENTNVGVRINSSSSMTNTFYGGSLTNPELQRKSSLKRKKNHQFPSAKKIPKPSTSSLKPTFFANPTSYVPLFPDAKKRKRRKKSRRTKSGSKRHYKKMAKQQPHKGIVISENRKDGRSKLTKYDPSTKKDIFANSQLAGVKTRPPVEKREKQLSHNLAEESGVLKQSGPEHHHLPASKSSQNRRLPRPKKQAKARIQNRENVPHSLLENMSIQRAISRSQSVSRHQSSNGVIHKRHHVMDSNGENIFDVQDIRENNGLRKYKENYFAEEARGRNNVASRARTVTQVATSDPIYPNTDASKITKTGHQFPAKKSPVSLTNALATIGSEGKKFARHRHHLNDKTNVKTSGLSNNVLELYSSMGLGSVGKEDEEDANGIKQQMMNIVKHEIVDIEKETRRISKEEKFENPKTIDNTAGASNEQVDSFNANPVSLPSQKLAVAFGGTSSFPNDEEMVGESTLKSIYGVTNQDMEEIKQEADQYHDFHPYFPGLSQKKRSLKSSECNCPKKVIRAIDQIQQFGQKAKDAIKKNDRREIKNLKRNLVEYAQDIKTVVNFTKENPKSKCYRNCGYQVFKRMIVQRLYDERTR